MSQGRQRNQNEVENPTMKKLRSWTLPIIKEACPLSISTRAIGFMLPEVARYADMWPEDDTSSDEDGVDNRIKAPLSAMYRTRTMDHHQKPKRRKRKNKNADKSREPQQQRQAGTQRPEDALITEPQRKVLAALSGQSCPKTCPLTVSPRGIGTQLSEVPLITESQRRMLVALDGPSYRKTCPLPISTRGIGLVISQVTSLVRERFRLRAEDIPIAAIYRASLAQLQAKMCFVWPRHTLNNLPGFKYEWESGVNVSRANMIRHERHYNLSPVALIIDSVGNVEINGKSFSPVFSRESNALSIRLDNLRRYCERMSDIGTDSSERIQGYELNSIPNARWERLDERDKKSLVLKNPDEIIPPDYDCNDMQTVLNDLQVTDRFCVYKLPLHPEELRAMINYCSNDGNPGMLVSTHVKPGQSLRIDNKLISGSQRQFWSPEPITHASWHVGALSLVGEVLNPMDGSSRSNVGGMRTVVDWDKISRKTIF